MKEQRRPILAGGGGQGKTLVQFFEIMSKWYIEAHLIYDIISVMPCIIKKIAHLLLDNCRWTRAHEKILENVCNRKSSLPLRDQLNNDQKGIALVGIGNPSKVHEQLWMTQPWITLVYVILFSAKNIKVRVARKRTSSFGNLKNQVVFCNINLFWCLWRPILVFMKANLDLKLPTVLVFLQNQFV